MSTDSDRLRRQRLLVAADWMWVLATLSAIAVILCAWKIHDVKTAPDPPPPPLCPLDCSACGDASCGVAIDDATCEAFGLYPASKRCSGAACCDGKAPFYDLEDFSSCGWDELYSNDTLVGCDCSRCTVSSSSGQTTVCGFLPTTEASGVNCDPDLCANYISGTCQLSKVEDLCNCEDCCGGVAGLCPNYDNNPDYTVYWNKVWSEWCNCTTCKFASTCEGLLDADCGASSCYLTTTLCSSGGYFPNDACGFCASGYTTTPWMQCVGCYEDSDCTDASKAYCQNRYTTVDDDQAYECVECVDSLDCAFEKCDGCDDKYICIPGGKCDPCSCESCNGDGSCTKVCAPGTYCWSGYVDSTLGIDTSCDETKHDASNAFSNCHLNTETMWCYTECASDADCATATVFDYYDGNDNSSTIPAPFCDMTTHTCQVCDFSQTECDSGEGKCYRIVDVDSSNLCAADGAGFRAPPSTNQCFTSTDEYCKTLSNPTECKKTTKNDFCPSDAAQACDGEGTTIMVDLSGTNLCLSSCDGSIDAYYCIKNAIACDPDGVCDSTNGSTCGNSSAQTMNITTFCGTNETMSTCDNIMGGKPETTDPYCTWIGTPDLAGGVTNFSPSAQGNGKYAPNGVGYFLPMTGVSNNTDANLQVNTWADIMDSKQYNGNNTGCLEQGLTYVKADGACSNAYDPWDANAFSKYDTDLYGTITNYADPMCKQFNKNQLDNHGVLQTYCTKGDKCPSGYDGDACKACPNTTGACLKGKSEFDSDSDSFIYMTNMSCYQGANQTGNYKACTGLKSTSDYDALTNLTTGAGGEVVFTMNQCRWNKIQDLPTGTGMCTSLSRQVLATDVGASFRTSMCIDGTCSADDDKSYAGSGVPCTLVNKAKDAVGRSDAAESCCSPTDLTNNPMPLCSRYTNAEDVDDIGYCSGHDCKDALYYYDESKCKDRITQGYECDWEVYLFGTNQDKCNALCDSGYTECRPASQCTDYDKNVTLCDDDEGSESSLGCGWSCIDATPESA